ncbi:MAG: hypothetical protein NTX50_16890, partial [Candidatus Sumerlaeota bacterium]|nr:hypothetical protein [Candidatus Sumerlaeota bacterium]
FTAAPYREKKKSQPSDTASAAAGGAAASAAGGAASANVPDLATGYWVGAAMADNIWGPYKKQPQVFLGGHIAVFKGPDGKEWMSYRGESGGKAQGRLCIAPIPFDEDGSVKVFEPSANPATIK